MIYIRISDRLNKPPEFNFTSAAFEMNTYRHDKFIQVINIYVTTNSKNRYAFLHDAYSRLMTSSLVLEKRKFSIFTLV